MAVLLHSVHIALLILGGIGVALLLRPAQPGHARAVRQLRAAAASGTIVELAYQRARSTMTPVRGRPRSAAALYALSFAGISVAVGLVANRLSGGVPPTWWSVAVLAGLLFLAGTWIFRRERSTRHIAALAIIAQVVVHAGLVLSLLYEAHRAGLRATASLADLLFCHRAGLAPTGAQVASASSGIDLGGSPTTGFISWGAAVVLVVSLAAAAAAACWLNRPQLSRRILAG